jgi:mannose-1-phosphate guanylyltransferase/phosphomannomutase
MAKKGMKAMVLAAGRGERMRPLTDHLAKPLLPIANRPAMGYILEHLGRHGFTEVVANVHYQAQEIMDCFGDGSAYGVHLTYSHEDRLWGSAGSVKRNAQFLGDDTFLVIGADDLTNMDLGALLAKHREAGAMASMGLVEVQETSQFGVVVTDESGAILYFVEKPKETPPSRTANTQIYLFEPEIQELIPAGEWYDFGFNVFPELVARGAPFYGFSVPGYWRDIGSLEDYLAAQRDVMEGHMPANIAGREVEPRVWVGRGCEIAPEAELEAPVVVGRGCRIGKGARLSGATSVADRVAVPEGAALWNCVLWPEARLSERTQLRQTVVGREGVVQSVA